jgi:hypothetical protein
MFMLFVCIAQGVIMYLLHIINIVLTISTSRLTKRKYLMILVTLILASAYLWYTYSICRLAAMWLSLIVIISFLMSIRR